MQQFYIAHLIDADGARLASEQVWSPDPGSEHYPEDYDLAIDMAPEKVVHDACAFFSTDDHGALDLDGATIRLFGPYTLDLALPAAEFTIAEPDPDSTDIYTATRIVPPPPPITTAKNSGGLWAAWHEDGTRAPGRAFGHKTEAEAVAALIGAKTLGVWVMRLQDTYDKDFEQFEGYCENYGLLPRLGFEDAQTAWDANPMIQGSTTPADFKVVPGTV